MMRVLVVDDAAVERALVARLLRELGHEVVAEAADIAEGAALAGRHAPDVTILDGRLPGGTLGAHLAAILSAHPGTRVAVIGALGELDLIRTARAAGAAGAVRRPVTRGGLEEALRVLAPSPPA